jgi:hypothetical protein
MPQPQKVIVIPKEDAVFWMDQHGRWNNEHGVFKNKKIIDYFHSKISRDENGYFVSQEQNDFIEKVYFRYEDTALFVFQVLEEHGLTLVLNTGERLPLNPQNLTIKKDILYTTKESERIRFTERAMMDISKYLDERDGQFFIQVEGVEYPIP